VKLDQSTIVFSASLVASVVVSSSSAQVIQYDDDFAGWSAAAGPYTTIDFVGFPVNTFITTQYSHLGAVFTNFGGPEVVRPFSMFAYPQDGYGVDGNFGIEILFSEPMRAVGMHAPGFFEIQLFSGDEMIFDSTVLFGGQGPNFFGGVASVQTFDRMRFVSGPVDDVYTDNIYFSTVPGPAVGVVIFCGALVGRRRRR
jgi:hypothetical protein